MDRKSAFEIRGRAFEDEYFGRKEAQLVDKLKRVFHEKVSKESIREATGIADEVLLDRLVELNLNGELMAAFNLLPVIEVAWADGAVDEREVKAVLAAAERLGLPTTGKAYAMLEARLREGPSKDARKLWYHYAETLKKVLSPKELAQFRDDLLDACRQVAQASGGLFNAVFTVSANERKVLEAVERALT